MEKDAKFGAWTYHLSGIVRAELGDTAAAINDLTKAIELNPEDADYFQNRAYMHYNQRHYDQAVSDATKANELNPEDTYNLEILARAYTHLDNTSAAIDTYRRAAAIDPVNADHWNQRADRLSEAQQVTPTAYRDTVAADQVELPQFPGGREALKAYICENLQYPEQVKATALTHQVVVDCLISATGQVTDCRVVQSAGKDFDAEALRVCRSLPRFTPAKRAGRPVQCWYQVTLTFAAHEASCCKQQP